MAKSTSKNDSPKPRPTRNFPASTFEDALELSLAIQEHSGGQPIRRLTLFDAVSYTHLTLPTTPYV